MDVYFTKWDPDNKMLKKTKKLYEEAKIFDVVEKGSPVAIKLHVGELGNPGYVQPFFVHQIVEMVKEKGGKPFLTDTTTLYRGRRNNAVDHINNALAHGFGFAPFIPADGLNGRDGVTVKSEGLLKEIEVASVISEVESMIVVTHLKGHIQAGYGGAIKNLAMGCTTKRCKMQQHQAIDICIDAEKCTGCGTCAETCFLKLFEVVDGKAKMEPKNCTRCMACIFECPAEAIKLENISNISKALASAAKGVLSTFKEGKVSFVNFAKDITSECDCISNPGKPVLDDIGIFASHSPLSVDAAIINKIGKKLNALHEGVDCFMQIEEAKRIGIKGDTNPKIVNVE